MIHLIERHLTRYPAMQPVDVYKLVYQCCMGVGHAIPDTGSVLEMLTSELDRIDQGPDEPIIDPISPSGHIIRVHLRPFRKARLDPRRLADAFLETARSILPDTEALLRSWSSVTDHLETRVMNRFAGDLDALNRLLIGHNFPAMHHSREYSDQYRPSYRVIAAEFYIPK